MTKSLIVAAALTLALGSNAFAATAMMCDEASMTQMQADMDANSTATMENKEKAKQEMMMAMDAMKANKMDECVLHMNAASEAGMKK